MNERPIRIVAKPRKEVDLKRLARLVIELARQQVEAGEETKPTATEPTEKSA